MSTDDPQAAAAQSRRLPIPADPSEDELARHWSLSPADLAVIAECRSPDHRRRFALQLCVMRTHGCFLDDYHRAPIKIVSHLSRQLGLAPVLFLDRPGRTQTEREQSLRIRRYLGVRGFDRSKQVHTEQLAFVDIYARQIARWRTAKPSADQTRELNRMDDQNQQLRTVTEAVLALVDELRQGTIEPASSNPSGNGHLRPARRARLR
jgi:Domain of unknown function (DUF4158)